MHKSSHPYVLGIIGLGDMGGRMCKHLLKNPSIPLYAFDVCETALDAVCALGARRCHCPAEVAQKASIILTILPHPNILRTVCLDPETGIFKGAQNRKPTTEEPETILVDSSTTGPTVTRELAKLAQTKGIVFLDAPVSGGIARAAEGTLTILLGADEQRHVELVKERLLKHMGRVVHCGSVGTGQAVKLCNNALLAQQVVAVAEAMALGKQLGISNDLLLDCFNQSTGECWATHVDSEIPLHHNYESDFYVHLAKDIGLACEEAKTKGLSVPAMDLAFSIYEQAKQSKKCKFDFESIFQDKSTENH